MVAKKGDGPATVVCYLLSCLIYASLLIAEDREVDLDDEKLQQMLNKEEKDEQEDTKEEMLEINEGEFVDNFIGGAQQHMNAFDLLLPTMEHQLRSGIKNSQSV